MAQIAATTRVQDPAHGFTTQVSAGLVWTRAHPGAALSSHAPAATLSVAAALTSTCH